MTDKTIKMITLATMRRAFKRINRKTHWIKYISGTFAFPKRKEFVKLIAQAQPMPHAKNWFTIDYPSTARNIVPDAQINCWCSYGALHDEAGNVNNFQFRLGITWLAKTAKELFPERTSVYSVEAAPTNLITNFNDHEATTHDDVIKVWRKAIKDFKASAHVEAI